MIVATMTFKQKLGIVWHKAVPLLPADVGRHLLALISPEAIGIMAGVLAIWAASHFTGVGEIADVALFIGGWATIGASAIEGIHKLISCAMTIRSAHAEADLDKAAHDLADGIITLGVDMALGLLFQGKPEGTFHHYTTKGIDQPVFADFMRTMPKAGPLRRYDYKLRFTKKQFAGQGGTTITNQTTIGRDWVPGSKTLAEATRSVRRAACHERVHAMVNRNISALGRPALWIKLGAYKRSYLLRYLDEFIAELNAQRKVGRGEAEPVAYEFPVSPTYDITVAKLGEEAKGIFLGPITIGGALYQVYYGLSHADQ